MADLENFSKHQFDEAYKRALERKRLFKEYLARHQVMEKLNGAIEQLYECERLPENPMAFIADLIKPTQNSSSGGGVGPGQAQGAGGSSRTTPRSVGTK